MIVSNKGTDLYDSHYFNRDFREIWNHPSGHRLSSPPLNISSDLRWQPPHDSGGKEETDWCRSRPVVSTCCGSNGQIHADYRNPVEKKGQHGHSLSEREGKRAQESPTPAWTGFYCFSGHITSGWSSFTMHRFSVGDYLLQITKERMLLITSKRRMLQIKGESGWTGYTPYLGDLAQTRKLKILSKHLQPQSRVREF